MPCFALSPPLALPGALRRPAARPAARPARAAPVRRGRGGAVSPLAVLPLGNLFGRVVIPNPNPAPLVPRTLLELLQTHPKWEVRKTADHGETAVPRLRMHLACAGKGHRVLEALQQELYESGEKGCRVRRESQTKFSLCCEGVEVLLNESHHDITVDVPIDMDAPPEVIKETAETLRRVEKVAHDALHSH